MDDRLLSVKVVAGMLDCSSRQVWKLLASGRLPRPLRLGRSVKWKSNDIARFIAAECDMRAFAAEVERREAVEA